MAEHSSATGIDAGDRRNISVALDGISDVGFFLEGLSLSRSPR